MQRNGEVGSFPLVADSSLPFNELHTVVAFPPPFWDSLPESVTNNRDAKSALAYANLRTYQPKGIARDPTHSDVVAWGST